MTASKDERTDVTGAESPTHESNGVRPTPDGPDEAKATEPTADDSTAGQDAKTASTDATDATDASADSTADSTTKPAKPKRKGSFWKELPILIGIALVLTFLIQTFIARVYVIPSGSMEETLNGCPGCTGDRILVDKLTYDFRSIEPGDVIVFKGPPGWSESGVNVTESNNVVIRWIRQFGSSIGIGSPPEYDLVKRVIAVGGQTVYCCNDNRVVVDGKPLNEPYIYWMPGMAPTQMSFAPVKVPQGYLWVMGDNRNNSDDSRLQDDGGIHGVVPTNDVIGIARTIIWPPGRWGGIGETNPQTTQAQSLPALDWPNSVPPLGVGALGAFPTLWLGKRVRRQLTRDRR